MNLFDNAQWLKIPELKELDNELLNYINYIYNEFSELHYTDDEWINIIKQEKSNNKDMSKFMQKYVSRLYISNSVNISCYTFIKYDTNRLKNIIEQLSIKQIYHMLNTIDYNDDIFFAIENIKKFKYLYSFVINHKRLYSHYIHIRIINSINFVIISYLLSKYSNDDLINFYQFIDNFLVDFYTRQNYINVSNELYLLKVINNEYVQKMQSFVYNLYDYYVQRFITNPDHLMLKFLLNYNIKSINNKNALKIIDFVKNEKSLFSKVIEKIILSCKLTNKQVNELKAYQLLNNI